MATLTLMGSSMWVTMSRLLVRLLLRPLEASVVHSQCLTPRQAHPQPRAALSIAEAWVWMVQFTWAAQWRLMVL